jgi:hypothetical protein
LSHSSFAQGLNTFSQEAVQMQDWMQQGLNQAKQAAGHVPLGPAREQAQQMINQAVDHFANLVPGGAQHAESAKQAIAKTLEELQHKLEEEAKKH